MYKASYALMDWHKWHAIRVLAATAGGSTMLPDSVLSHDERTNGVRVHMPYYAN